MHITVHPFLLALHTNLGEAQAKLDATAAARTGTEPPGPCTRIPNNGIFFFLAKMILTLGSCGLI